MTDKGEINKTYAAEMDGSHFQTPLLFQNFWIRVRKMFKFDNPTLVQTSDAIDATEIQQCFHQK